MSSFSFSRSFSSFFSPSPRPSSSFSVLDGYRSFLCLWMVAFHCLFFLNAFQPSAVFSQFVSTLWIVPFAVGFLAVDGFFILTGYLLALPLFQHERLLIKQWKEDNQGIKQSFSVFSFWWRRFSRLIPVYAFALLFYCYLFHPYQYDRSLMRSENLLWFMDLVSKEEKGAGANCNLIQFNFMHLNHLLPFGGCLGVTWSFSVQFHFYVLFPLLWSFCSKRYERRIQKFQNEKKLSKAPAEPMSASEELLRWFNYFILFSVLLRCFSYFQLRVMPLQHPVGMFMGFHWYCNTFIRMSAILVGVHLAKLSVSPSSFPSFKLLQGSFRLQNACNLLCITIFLLIGYWNFIFAEGHQLELPGESAIRLSQEILGHPPRLDLSFLDGFFSHFHHFFYYSFLQVSSIGSLFLFAYLLIISTHSIGWLGRLLHKFFCFSLFRQISALSMFAYFLHPSIMIWFYAKFSTWFPDWTISVPVMIGFEVAIFIMTFSLSFLLHLFLELPLEHLLRGSDENRGFFMKLLYWLSIVYGCILVITSSLGNLAGFILPIVTAPPEGVDFSFRRPANLTEIYHRA
jgi:peptidoglycan/LPS O-acetylase OafA/YrhL